MQTRFQHSKLMFDFCQKVYLRTCSTTIITQIWLPTQMSALALKFALLPDPHLKLTVYRTVVHPNSD